MDSTKDILQDKWPELRDRVRRKWSRFSAEDIAGLNGKAEELAVVLRERYHYGRVEADMEMRS